MTGLSPIGRQIHEALAIFLRRDPSTIKPEHHLREDLGLDSLMTFELLYELEKAFDLEIPNEDLPGLQTLADIVTYVETRLHSSMPLAKTAPNTLRSKGKSRQLKTATPKKSGKVKPTTQPATKVKKRGSGPTVKKRAAFAKSKGKKP